MTDRYTKRKQENGKEKKRKEKKQKRKKIMAL